MMVNDAVIFDLPDEEFDIKPLYDSGADKNNPDDAGCNS
jgi:hypothetical protein